MINIVLIGLSVNLIDNSSSPIQIIIAVVAASTMFFAYSAAAIPVTCHPCFLFQGYHFYKVMFDSSNKERLLIAKSDQVSDLQLPIDIIQVTDYVWIAKKHK